MRCPTSSRRFGSISLGVRHSCPGIVHQISVLGATIPANSPAATTPNLFQGATFSGFRPDTEYGYGIQAGVKFNLP